MISAPSRAATGATAAPHCMAPPFSSKVKVAGALRARASWSGQASTAALIASAAAMAVARYL